MAVAAAGLACSTASLHAALAHPTFATMASSSHCLQHGALDYTGPAALDNSYIIADSVALATAFYESRLRGDRSAGGDGRALF